MDYLFIFSNEILVWCLSKNNVKRIKKNIIFNGLFKRALIQLY